MSATILVVDDSPLEMGKIKSILQNHDFKVLEATNGADAVVMAQHNLPDLILMDVVMPMMNGFQATRQITRDELTQHIPVIIVSTKDQETDRIWGKRQGASDYLIKPVNEADLLNVIKTYIRRV